MTLGDPHIHVNTRPIVLISPSLEMWGAESSLVDLAQGIAETGRSITVITPNDRLRARLELASADIRVLVLPIHGSSRWARVNFFFRAHNTVGDDAVVVCWEETLLVGAALRRSRVRRRRQTIVADLHNSYSGVKRRVMRIVVRAGADKCCAVSRYIEQQFVGTRPVRVIWRPLKARAVNPLWRSDANRQFTIGVVGRVSAQKHTADALKVLDRIEFDAVLRVRGDEDDRSPGYLRQLLHDATRFGDRFVYDGRQDSRVVFNGLDVLLHLNAEEPSGRVIAEAQLEGLPSVVPAAGGAAEFVSDPSLGARFTAGDMDAAAAAIRDVRERSLSPQVVADFAARNYDLVTQSERYASWVLDRGGRRDEHG